MESWDEQELLFVILLGQKQFDLRGFHSFKKFKEKDSSLNLVENTAGNV